MDDLHAINEAVNAKAGRKLLPSIIVSLLLLALVFSTVYYIPFLFGVLVWVAIMLGIRELTRAYKIGGIEIPERVVQLAASVLLLSAWYGRVSGLAVATAIAIPNVLVLILFKGPKDFLKKATAAAFAIFYLAFLGGFILLIAHNENGVARVFTLIVLVSCNDTFAYLSLIHISEPTRPY